MRELVNILEASLLVAGKPLSLNQIESLFEHEDEKPSRDDLRNALDLLRESLTTRGIELVEVASGYRLQARQDYAPWVANLMQERAPRYSRALLETLVLIAYRQPITRGEVEDVRGVAVSTNIVRTLLEREWIRVLGHKDVPGRPAIYGTTKQFLDYFNLKRIDELPTLSEIKDLDQIDPDLAKEVALLEAQELAEQAEVQSVNESSEASTGESSDGMAVEAEGQSDHDSTADVNLQAERDQTEREQAEQQHSEHHQDTSQQDFSELQEHSDTIEHSANGDSEVNDHITDDTAVAEHSSGAESTLDTDHHRDDSADDPNTTREATREAQGDAGLLEQLQTEPGDSITVH